MARKSVRQRRRLPLRKKKLLRSSRWKRRGRSKKSVRVRVNWKKRGRAQGLHDGFQEGYLRARADVLFNTVHPDVKYRPLHVLYVSTGKGMPYSPIDEAMVASLQGLVSRVTIAGPKDSVASMAADLRPDLVLVLDGMDFTAEQLDELRNLGIRTAVWITDDPYYTDTMARVVTHYHYVFTLELNNVGFYQSLGCPHVYYLPFGAYSGHFRPKTTPSPGQRDVGFVGTAYWNRVRFFEPIVDRMMQYNAYFSGLWWDRLSKYHHYESRIDLGKWMSPQDTAETYNTTKIVINMHRSPDDESVNTNSTRIMASSPNPRTFEIMLCGTLQLTDIRSDLGRFYTPGVEIETYSSPEEMMAKIDHYLKHEDERRNIALRGLERTLRDHTYANRLNQLLGTIFG